MSAFYTYHYYYSIFVFSTDHVVKPRWSIWVGLTNLNDNYDWVWNDSSPVDFLYWKPEHPQTGKHCGFVSKPRILLFLETSNDVSSIYNLNNTPSFFVTNLLIIMMVCVFSLWE